MTGLSNGAARPSSRPLLVVDDEVDVREAVAVILRTHGFGVTTARDGAEAMLRVAEDRPSLVVLDWRLPGQDGGAVAEAIRGQHPDAIFLLVTADGRAAAKADTIQTPWYLSKPFDPAQLVEMVRAALGGG